MYQLQWIKSLDNKWLDFTRLDLAQVRGGGVYIIWHGGTNPRVVRVGHGQFAQKFAEHRQNTQLMWYASQGPLFVTWAEVSSEAHRAGIETYLAQQFSPLLGQQLPSSVPLPVYSPFG